MYSGQVMKLAVAVEACLRDDGRCGHDDGAAEPAQLTDERLEEESRVLAIREFGCDPHVNDGSQEARSCLAGAGASELRGEMQRPAER